MMETLSNFDNVSSVRDREAVLIDPIQNENELQVWTQRETDNTKKEKAELRKEMNENVQRMTREVKNSRRIQSIPRRKDTEQTTLRIETLKHMNNGDGEINASDTENQENRIQDIPFRPSEGNEPRTPIQPISVQNLQ